jgi:hypothetical protein
MDVRTALKEQYHGGLAHLAFCIDLCPEDIWVGKTPDRPYWRIVYHTLYFTQVYLGQTSKDYEPWPSHRPDLAPYFKDCEKYEPFEIECHEPCSRSLMLEYLAYIDERVHAIVDQLDLEADSGFSWYPGIGKLSHQIMNIRHIEGHVGQLGERLMAHDPDVDIGWVERARHYLDTFN